MIELGHVTERKPPFHYAALARVAFSDTDAQGVVYYGRYMPYFDLARVEFHRHLGGPHLANVDFAMRAVTVEYVAPARF
ncbi:MAG: acyl-CoA thioesterase, partial [Gaiellaceae bacterium]